MTDPASPGRKVPKAVLDLTVRTPSGYKVPGAHVELWDLLVTKTGASGAKRGKLVETLRTRTYSQGKHVWAVKVNTPGFGAPPASDGEFHPGEVSLIIDAPAEDKVHKHEVVVAGDAELLVIVRTPGGRPIPDARVEVWGLRVKTTDKNGCVRWPGNGGTDRLPVWFDPDGPGAEVAKRRPWAIKVSAPGYARPTPTIDTYDPKLGEVVETLEAKVDSTIDEASGRNVVVVKLAPPSFDLSITVRDPSRKQPKHPAGAPVADALTEIVGLRGTIDPSQPPAARTDAKGRVAFPELNLVRGDGTKFTKLGVKAFKPGHGPRPAASTLWKEGEVGAVIDPAAPGGKKDLVFDLVQGSARLVVEVVRPAPPGKKPAPIEGATVELWALGARTTGADGKADFGEQPIKYGDPANGHPITERKWAVKVSKPHFGPPPAAGKPVTPGTVEVDVLQVPGTTHTVQVKLVGGFTLKGKLFFSRTWDYKSQTPIPAVKTPLPSTLVELHVERADTGGALQKLAEGYLTADGAFEFKDVPACNKAALKVYLAHEQAPSGNRVAIFFGLRNGAVTTPFSETDFLVKDGELVWHRLHLDAAKVSSATGELDLGELELKHAHFVDLCDAYVSIVKSHAELKRLTGEELVKVANLQVNYPDPVISQCGAKMSLLKSDLRDRAVIMHEYGHFIGWIKLNGLNNPGYFFNDDGPRHGPGQLEHYEAAWVEGHATYLGCELGATPLYYDGWEPSGPGSPTDISQTNFKKRGGHDEGAIQELLWALSKHVPLKDGFWKVFVSPPKVTTIYEFLDRWTSLGLPHRDKLVALMNLHDMTFGYRYVGGHGTSTTDRWTCVAAPATFDAANKKFVTLDELFNQFGSAPGEPTDAAAVSARKIEFLREFYNRNKYFTGSNPPNDNVPVGSNPASPTVSAGQAYIVPQRFKIS